MKPKCYIAGKITGDLNYQSKFDRAAEVYERQGYTVLLPTVLPVELSNADYMRICFAMIDSADVVVFLPDYVHSAGAQLEHHYCLYTDKVIVHLQALAPATVTTSV